MSIVLATVTLPAVSGVPEDDVVNNIVISGPLPFQGDTLPLTQAIREFYNNPNEVDMANKVATYISRNRSRGVSAVSVKYYDVTNALDGSPHGSPTAVDAFTLENSGANVPLPDEASAVLTLRAANYTSYPVEAPDAADEGFAIDRPRQRRTGRLYIGPLDGGAAEAVAPNYVLRPKLVFRNAVLNSAQLMLNALQAIGYDWVIWSRQNEATVPVREVQMDDAFDTQRRRGPRQTTRTSLVIA